MPARMAAKLGQEAGDRHDERQRKQECENRIEPGQPIDDLRHVRVNLQSDRRNGAFRMALPEQGPSKVRSFNPLARVEVARGNFSINACASRMYLNPCVRKARLQELPREHNDDQNSPTTFPFTTKRAPTAHTGGA